MIRLRIVVKMTLTTIDADEHSDQRKQKFLVFVRNRKVQCPLDNHRRNVAERAADATQKDRKNHPFCIFFDIG